jgi:hypothetical protein
VTGGDRFRRFKDQVDKITEEGQLEKGEPEDVLTKKDIIEGVQTDDVELPTEDKVTLDNLPKLKSINKQRLLIAVERATTKRQRFGAWEPEASAMLLYLDSVIPQFSKSEIIGELVKRGLAERYPELFQQVRNQMRNR